MMKKFFTLLVAGVCMLTMQAATVTVTPNGNLCDVTVDETTYSNVPVTTQGDIHVLAINREGISLLVRYTDTNTLVADGIVSGEAIHYATAAAATYAESFQIPNSGFESWVSSSNEPVNWHGFKSAKGILAGLAQGTLASSTDVRPGTTGTSSALITSGSVWGIVNNGTMTNGQLNAASATAANTANHSEMDQSSTATDNNGDPFFTALNAAPDAIKTWIKFSQGTANSDYPYATMSAIAFDGSYYQDPEDKTYTNVAAKAQNKTIAECGWNEMTIPFTYTNASLAKAILVTISTNATPGKGSNGDKVWVDDMSLVYNAGITGITLDGVTLDGFNFDAATTDYAVTYDGTPITLTADNFVVTTEGQSAIVVKNVEDLGGGNYRVAIAVTSPDFVNYALYTITVTHNTLTGDLYILGDINGKGWHANDAVQMTATDNENVFTAEVYTEGGSNYFGFTTMLAENDDEGGWNYILPYRISAPGEGTDLAIEIATDDLGSALPLGDWGKTRAYGLPAGYWRFTVNLDERTLIVEQMSEPMPESLYIVGDVNGMGWHANSGVAMTPNEDNSVFTADVTTAGENSGKSYFRFTSVLAENDDDGGWAYMMPYNIGAATADYHITADAYGTALPMGEWGSINNFDLPAGEWNFVVDLSARTLTVSQVATPVQGDVDGDGIVDVSDVNALVNVILGRASFDTYPAADIDGDGIVDVSDVNALVNIILGKN